MTQFKYENTPATLLAIANSGRGRPKSPLRVAIEGLPAGKMIRLTDTPVVVARTVVSNVIAKTGKRLSVRTLDDGAIAVIALPGN
jgi:hypothetical protein